MSTRGMGGSYSMSTESVGGRKKIRRIQGSFRVDRSPDCGRKLNAQASGLPSPPSQSRVVLSRPS